MAATCCSIAMDSSKKSRPRGAFPPRSTPDSPIAATTITEFLPTATRWSSAISHRKITARWSTPCRSPGELRIASPKMLPRTGMAGHPTEKSWLLSVSATVSSTSTQSPSRVEMKLASPTQKVWTMVLSIRRTENTSISIPSAPATCRSGVCNPTAASRSKSPTTTSTTGSRTFLPTANGW